MSISTMSAGTMSSSTMSTGAVSTGTRPRRTRERASWTCENCHGHSTGLRKRCAECGTSRY